MNSDDGDPARRYEEKTINVINETKSAVVGTTRGLWASLPNGLKSIIGVVITIFAIYFVLFKVVFPVLKLILGAIAK